MNDNRSKAYAAEVADLAAAGADATTISNILWSLERMITAAAIKRTPAALVETYISEETEKAIARVKLDPNFDPADMLEEVRRRIIAGPVA